MSSGSKNSDTNPTRGFAPSASLDGLRQRAALLRKLRRFFEERDFWEVETPCLGTETIVDRHLDPLSVDWPFAKSTASPHRGWLQTSPELHMKRLVAAGAAAIYQVTRAFRGDEFGTLHNPEFTLVEWYRVGDTYHAGMELLADLCEHLLPWGRPQRLTYEAAFGATLSINPHTASLKQLSDAAERSGIVPPESFGESDRDAWLHLLFSDRIEPTLGGDRPVIVCDYPASQAALAQLSPDHPPVAQRFELYARGIELANGYHELQDADALLKRQQQANDARQADGKGQLPLPESLIGAMRQGLPPCCGVALGFDRLVMLALGAHRLADVLAFPWSHV